MYKHSGLLTFVVSCVLFSSAATYAQFPAQRPEGYVNDLAGVMTPAGRQRIEALCTELDQKAKAQLAVVTVRSLQGRPLEEFTVDLATRWGVGPKGGDRGILLFLAIDDRESRIEVGYGLEPVITDGRAGSILRAMVPYLQRSDYDGALWLGATSLAQPIAQESGVTLAALAARPPPLAPVPRWEDQVLGEWLPIALWVIFGIFFFGPLVLMMLPKRWRRKMGGFGNWVDTQSSSGGYRGRHGGWGGGGWPGGGGWSSGGGGFGGFGGGSFGGGGASGKW